LAAGLRVRVVPAAGFALAAGALAGVALAVVVFAAPVLAVDLFSADEAALLAGLLVVRRGDLDADWLAACRVVL